jgi:hypothetical protein
MVLVMADDGQFERVPSGGRYSDPSPGGSETWPTEPFLPR